jgi:membrane associated rhomboid family serine protease
VVTLLLFYLYEPHPFQSPASPGAFSVKSFLEGSWWLALSATTLHADVAHLATNLVFGILLLGSAMARFGAARALIASTIAGAAGFVLVGIVRSPNTVSLGASGVVMGALGLLSVGNFHAFKHLSSAARTRRSLVDWMRGVLLFALIGLDPDADVVAHLGGFFAGTLLGCLPAVRKPSNTPAHLEAVLLIAWILVIGLAWALALADSPVPASFVPPRPVIPQAL